ncbi:hypothetical protein FGO68_gene393 [Halteria grandinella]|uniref:Uncharacterized protein n=1 Tax=Halteria grandinella TaxID=5974 RepID=A0A8J8P9G5_HALGN|nr:hypothetical protein FGO68_gene393 [Halteria grandinella]
MLAVPIRLFLQQYFTSMLRQVLSKQYILGCHSTCADWCIGPEATQCIQCPKSYQYRDLDTWKCVDVCAADKSFNVEITSEQHQSSFKYCRGFNYYVDPSSSFSNIELGTQNFPFKALDDPFRELFNFGVPALSKRVNSLPLITVNIMHGSNTTIHSDNMPLIMVNSDVLIQQGNIFSPIFLGRILITERSTWNSIELL